MAYHSFSQGCPQKFNVFAFFVGFLAQCEAKEAEVDSKSQGLSGGEGVGEATAKLSNDWRIIMVT